MRQSYLLFIISILLLTACGLHPQEQTPTAAEDVEIPDRLITPSPTSTQAVPLTLSICTGEFPESLFPYDGSVSRTKTNIYAMIQENPFEMVDGKLQAVILDKVPSQTDGDLRLESILVQEGQIVVDAWGDLVVLKPGVLVKPSSCLKSDCAITWDGVESLEMDRMVVDYRLREDLAWSDGIPVTANDSQFSYLLAKRAKGADQWALERTESYTVLEVRTVQWIGRPGFSSAQLEKFFWNPQPYHLFDESWTWSAVRDDERMKISPLSFGPFVLSAWEEEQMQFEPNPNYLKADEGLPFLEAVTFQLVVGGPQAAWEALQSGKCDLLDSTFGIENEPELLSVIKEDQMVDLHVMMRGDWVQLVFGIQSGSSGDIDFSAEYDHPGFLIDPLTRQAVAACLDRERMRDAATGGLSALRPSFLPPERSQLDPDSQIIFDLQSGGELLTQVGWGDVDGDPKTPRQAVNVESIPMGSELSLSLLVSNSGLHQDLAGVIKDSLEACGIGVNVTSMPSNELYAPGPSGPLFGRRFDLALVSWQPMPDLDCRYYQTSQIPDKENFWIGTNIAGFSDVEYDRSCGDAAFALLPDNSQTVFNAEQLFLSEMPSVPLFSTPEIVVSSAKVCFDREGSSEQEIFTSLAYYNDCP